jgi:hypothetical protein
LIKELENFEYLICKILYIYHNKKEPQKEKNQSKILIFCLNIDPDLIFNSQSLNFVLNDKHTSIEEKKENIKSKQINMNSQSIIKGLDDLNLDEDEVPQN